MNPTLPFPELAERHRVREPKRNLARRVFSFPVAISGVLSALAVLTARARFNDPDLWWHLKTGQFIWNHHQIPTTDHFSFTAASQAWIPHEWLAQLAIFTAWRIGGNTGLMLALCAVASAILIAGYALCAAYSRNAKVAFLGALIIFVFATSGFSIRPQLLGYLLLIVELGIFHIGRSRSAKWFFALVPLFALWVNVHGSFFMGLVVAGVVYACSFFQSEAGALLADSWRPTQRKILGTALVLSVLATFLNPGGIRQVLYPLDTMLRQPINLASIEEWHPLALNSQLRVCLLAILGSIFLLMVLRKAEIYLDELILLALGLWLAGSHERLVFVFGILAAPILSRMLAGLWDDYIPERDRILPNALLLVLAGVAIVAAFPNAKNIAGQIEAQNPVKALEYLRAHPISGNMLNEYQFGGYLIWAAPEHPVFIDGRADLYEWAGVLGQYTAWSGLQADPRTLLDKYRINLCLLSAQSPMVHAMALLPAWKQVYADSNAVLLQRITPLQ